MIKRVMPYLLFFMSVSAHGQLFSLSDQYISNMMAINPAFAGAHDALSTTMAYRNQWAGFAGAPEDLTFTAHAPLRNDRMGLGLMIDRVSSGIFSTTDVSGNYAHRLETGRGILALGLGFGASFYNIAWNRIQAADKDDQMLINGREAAILPDFSLGAYYYTDRFFAGFSVPRFLSHEYDKNSGKFRMHNDFSEYTFLLSSGFFAKVNGQMTLFPSAVVSYNASHAPQLYVNTSMILKDKIWLGAGYKTTNSITGMLRYQVNYQLMLAYSYDLELGKFGKYSNGSHEIVLGYVFRYLRNVTGPRHF